MVNDVDAEVSPDCWSPSHQLMGEFAGGMMELAVRGFVGCSLQNLIENVAESFTFLHTVRCDLVLIIVGEVVAELAHKKAKTGGKE